MLAISRRRFCSFSALAAASFGVSGLVGCAPPGQTDQDATDSNTVVVAFDPSSEPSHGFDPLFGWGCGRDTHNPLIQSTLVTVDADLNIVADAATSYEYDEEELTWTFEVRDDILFSNGQPLTADDVAFTLNTLRDNDTDTIDLSAIDYVDTDGTQKVIIHLLRASNTLLYSLAVVGIVPSDSYEELSYGTKPVGSGPYQLDSWERGQRVVLKANTRYYGSAPNIDTVEIKFLDEDASCGACYNGEVDIAWTSARLSSQSIDAYSLLDCKTVDSWGVSFPLMETAVTADVAVRRALNMAIDRKKLISGSLAGYADEAYTVGAGLPWASTDAKITTDVEGAKNLMLQAGWTLASDGIFSKGASRAAFDICYDTKSKLSKEVVSALADQLKAAGFEIDPRPMAVEDIEEASFSDAALLRLGSVSPDELIEIYHTDGRFNYSGYSNQTVDAHLMAASEAATLDDALPEWKAAQWDGSSGPAPQGDAVWAWLANVDHLYFKLSDLEVGRQKVHPHGSGWPLLDTVSQWSWRSEKR